MCTVQYHIVDAHKSGFPEAKEIRVPSPWLLSTFLHGCPWLHPGRTNFPNHYQSLSSLLKPSFNLLGPILVSMDVCDLRLSWYLSPILHLSIHIWPMRPTSCTCLFTAKCDRRPIKLWETSQRDPVAVLLFHYPLCKNKKSGQLLRRSWEKFWASLKFK